MKAILIFNLPEEKEDYKECTSGSDLYSACRDFCNWIRGEIKHNDKLTEAQYDAYEKIFEEFLEYLQDNDINLWG